MAGGPNSSVYISGLVREPIDWFWETSWRPPYQTGLDPQVPNFPIENAQRYSKSINLNGTNWVYDNFEDAALDSVLWSQTEIFYGYPLEGSISQSGGALTLTSGNGVAAPTAKGMVTNYIYDLTVGGGRSVYARVTISNANDNNYTMFVGKAGNYRLGIEIASGTIRLAYYAPDGRITATSSAAIGASFDGWIRLRYDHAALTFYLDTATTGASNPPVGGDWTNQRSIGKFPAHDATCQNVGFSIANSFGAGTTTMVVGSINVGTAATIPNESISATASLVAVKVFIRSISALTTPTFSIVSKWVGKGLSVSSALAAALVRSIAKRQSITSTPSFTLVKMAGKFISASGGGAKTPAISSVGTVLDSTGASGAVPMPTYAAGDLVLVLIEWCSSNEFSGSGTTTPPAGWDLIDAHDAGNSTITMLLYARRMDGSEGSSVTFTWNGSGLNRHVQGRAATLQNVLEVGTYLESINYVEGSSTTVGSVAMVSPSMTTGGDNRIIINCFGTSRGVDDTQVESADAYTDAFANATATSGSLHIDSAMSYQVVASAASPTAETRHKDYASGGSVNWLYVSLVLKPAFAGPVTSIVRAVSKAYLVTVAATVSILRSLARSISTNIATTSAVVKSAAHIITISSSESAAVYHSTGKILSVVASTSAAMARSAGKIVTLAASVSTTIVRAVAKVINFAADAVVALDASFSGSGGTAYNQTVVISSTPSFGIVRAMSKTLNLAIDAFASKALVVGKNISATASGAASIVRRTLRTIVSTANSSQTISRAMARFAEADASTVQSINRSIGRTLALVASVSTAIVWVISRTIGSSTTPISGVVRAPGRNISVSSSSVQAIIHAVARTAEVDIATAQAVIKATSRTMMQAASGLANMISMRTFLRTIETTVSSAQTIVKAIARALSPTSSTVASVSRANSRTIQQSAITSFSISRLIGRIVGISSTPRTTTIKSTTRTFSILVAVSATLIVIEGLFVTLSAATAPITSIVRRISRKIGAVVSGIASLLHIGPTLRQVIAGFINRSKSVDAQTRTIAVDAQVRSFDVSPEVRSIAADVSDREIDTSRRIE